MSTRSWEFRDATKKCPLCRNNFLCHLGTPKSFTFVQSELSNAKCQVIDAEDICNKKWWSINTEVGFNFGILVSTEIRILFDPEERNLNLSGNWQVLHVLCQQRSQCWRWSSSIQVNPKPTLAFHLKYCTGFLPKALE